MYSEYFDDKTDRYILKHSFENLYEYYAHVIDLPDCSDSVRDETGSFYGEGDWDQVQKYSLIGWEEGLEMVSEADVMINSFGIDMPTYTRDLYGESIDMGIFLSGQPDCFIRENDSNELHATGRIKRIAVGGSYLAGVSTTQVINRGAVIMSLIDGLEARGFRTEIHIITSSQGVSADLSRKGKRYSASDVAHCCRVIAKQAEDAFNREKLAFALMHPAFFRRFNFILKENLPDGGNDTFGAPSGGYGRTINAHDNLHHWGDDYDIVFKNTNWEEYSDRRNAKDKVLELLKEQGIEVN